MPPRTTRPGLSPHVVDTTRGPFAVLTAGARTGGQGEVIVLAAPGTDGAGLAARLVAEGRRVVVVDPQRGDAGSPAVGAWAGVAASALDVLAIAAACRTVSAGVDLVDLACGGEVGMQAALLEPDAVNTLAVVPTPALAGGSVDLRAQLVRRPVPTLDLTAAEPGGLVGAHNARRLAELWRCWGTRQALVHLRLRTGSDSGSDQVPRARREVRDAVVTLLPPEGAQDVELVVSELVTNALVHARPPVDLQVWQRGDWVEARVSDAGPREPSGPGVRPHHGRGWTVVAAVSDRHGWWTDERGAHAWAQVRTRRG